MRQCIGVEDAGDLAVGIVTRGPMHFNGAFRRLVRSGYYKSMGLS